MENETTEKSGVVEDKRETTGSVSDLPERLQGERGMLALLSECKIRLDASQNVSLVADIEAVLKQNVGDETRGTET
jgi:hypothetical protein